MQGTSSLTAYAGQVVTLTGSSSLRVSDFDCLMQGAGSLTVLERQEATSTMEGTGYLYAQASYYYGRAQLSALTSIGRDDINITSHGAADLQALTSEGSIAPAYDPEAISTGYGNLSILASSGIITQSDYGEGEASLPSLESKGGDYVYGESYNELPSLLAFASYSNLASGFIKLKNISITATTVESIDHLGIGEINLKAIKVEGYAAPIGEIVLQPLEVNGVAYTDHFSTGTVFFKTLIVESFASFIALSGGNIELPSLKVLGTGIFIPAADGEILLKLLKINGTADFSPLGDRAGNIVLPKLIVSGVVNNAEAPQVLKHTRNPEC